MNNIVNQWNLVTLVLLSVCIYSIYIFSSQISQLVRLSSTSSSDVFFNAVSLSQKMGSTRISYDKSQLISHRAGFELCTIL
jgi:hypothetical protein